MAPVGKLVCLYFLCSFRCCSCWRAWNLVLNKISFEVISTAAVNLIAYIQRRCSRSAWIINTIKGSSGKVCVLSQSIHFPFSSIIFDSSSSSVLVSCFCIPVIFTLTLRNRPKTVSSWRTGLTMVANRLYFEAVTRYWKILVSYITWFSRWFLECPQFLFVWIFRCELNGWQM